MSFYRKEGESLSIAPNAVYGKGYTLTASDHVSYTLPVDGWHWFDTDEEAYSYFNLPMPVEGIPQQGDTQVSDDLDQIIIDYLEGDL